MGETKKKKKKGNGIGKVNAPDSEVNDDGIADTRES
jgi:hypothetical protein